MLNEDGERVMTNQRMCAVISTRDSYDDLGVACTVAGPKTRTEPDKAGDDRLFEKS
jgi:hypothetical protein